MSRRFKIALAQFDSSLGDVEANLKKFEEFVENAALQGADMLCFPELFATGYNLDLLKDKMLSLSTEYYPRLVDSVCRAAAKHQIYIVAPLGIPRDGKLYNGAILVDSQGQQIGEYCKTHAFYLEKQCFEDGDSYQIFDTPFGKIGILICYDVGFPEAARSLCLLGAEVIFVPAAWRVEDRTSWELNVPSRALENLLFTVGVNRYGQEGPLHLFGGSMVCGPSGEVLHKATTKGETLDVFEIDLEEVARYRHDVGYLKDRRPALYQRYDRV